VIREYVYGRAAVSPQQGKFSALVLPGVDAEARAVFLAPTSADFPGAYGLLLDGAGGHRAVARRVPPPLRLLPLPPYSPELNPLDHLGDHRRENCFGNRVFPSLRAVVDCLCQGLSDLDSQPEVVKSITCFDWIKALHLT